MLSGAELIASALSVQAHPGLGPGSRGVLRHAVAFTRSHRGLHAGRVCARWRRRLAFWRTAGPTGGGHRTIRPSRRRGLEDLRSAGLMDGPARLVARFDDHVLLWERRGEPAGHERQQPGSVLIVVQSALPALDGQALDIIKVGVDLESVGLGVEGGDLPLAVEDHQLDARHWGRAEPSHALGHGIGDPALAEIQRIDRRSRQGRLVVGEEDAVAWCGVFQLDRALGAEAVGHLVEGGIGPVGAQGQDLFPPEPPIRERADPTAEENSLARQAMRLGRGAR